MSDSISSPEMGSIVPGKTELSDGPKVESSLAGFKPATHTTPEDNTVKIASIKEQLVKARTQGPDLDPEATARMMKDNQKALETQQKQVVIVQEHPVTGVLRLIGGALSSLFKR